jgi:hypothetical protein
MNRPISIVLALAIAAPLAAQGGTMGGMNMDPTTKVLGSGKLPAGWMLRFDPVAARAGQPAPAPHAMTEINLVTMGTGLHFTSGPAAIYYRPADAAKGEYTVSAKFSQAKSMKHEAYGLFIGGANLQDASQTYLYFLVRPLDGGIYIQQRMSDAAPARGSGILPWTPDASANKESPKDSSATNELAIHVGKDVVQFLANGKVVKEVPKSQLNGMSTDGIAGLRINHNLDVHVEGFAVKKR